VKQGQAGGRGVEISKERGERKEKVKEGVIQWKCLIHMNENRLMKP
jgi:hypothetical protein